MKRMSLLIGAFALASATLGGVSTADAALASRSTTFGAVTGGHPTWYVDSAGLAAAPCLDSLGFCGMAPEATFNGTLPATFPNNILEEWFYWSAVAEFTLNGAPALVTFALEAVYLDQFGALVPPNTPGAQPGVFQRMRVDLDNALAGTYTLEHPWGATQFTCTNAGICRGLDRDLGGAVANDFDSALGNGTFTPPDNSISTFLVQAGIAPPAGYFGDGVNITTVTGGTVRNRVDITGPASGGTANFTVTGKKIGMEVSPTSLNLGAATIQTPPVPSAPQRVTAINLSGNAIVFPTLAATGTDAADFAAVAPATGTNPFCSGATVASGSACSFDVTFTPAASAVAARTGAIVLAPTSVQPDPLNPTLPDPPPVTINLSGTAQYLLTVTVPSNATAGGKVDGAPTGIANCTGPAGTCSAAYDAGSSVTLTPTGAATAPLSLFDAWGGDCSGSGPCTVAMNAAKSATATFVPAFTVATSRTPSNGGTITATQVSKQASSPQLTITPGSCFHIATLTDNSSPVNATPVQGTTAFTYTVANVTADRNVAVGFSNQQTITKSAGANGSISGPDTVTCGTASTTYTVTPSSKFRVKSISLDGQAQSFTPAATPAGAITFPITNINADKTVAATFMPSGDVDGDGTLGLADALKAMRIYVGVQTPEGTDLQAMKVTPLDSNGKPNGTGDPNLNDILLILKRVLGLVTW